MKYILGAITVDTRYDLPAHRHTHTHIWYDMIWYDIQVILIVGTEIDRYLGLAKQETMFYVGRD